MRRSRLVGCLALMAQLPQLVFGQLEFVAQRIPLFVQRREVFISARQLSHQGSEVGRSSPRRGSVPPSRSLVLVVDLLHLIGDADQVIYPENPAQVLAQSEGAYRLVVDGTAWQGRCSREKLNRRPEGLGEHGVQQCGVERVAAECCLDIRLSDGVDHASNGENPVVGQFDLDIDARFVGADATSSDRIHPGERAVEAPRSGFDQRRLANAILGQHEGNAGPNLEGLLLE
ncbi:hypothetical protein [Blastococcus sp. CT_GayMR20]|uniref:hypothetical protein n=1 Tax=Blastococcus sp. CT_GayMR20 TaxID=2559609 RepID=UPI001FD7B90C|nr:hypothetical protein [Blastococcus sp. CT_GayMR20]